MSTCRFDRTTVCLGCLCTVLCLNLSMAQTTRAVAFDDSEALQGWHLEGDVELDGSRSHGQQGSALRIGPGGRAELTLRDEDGSGTVEFWVYDDGSAPAKPKVRITGPYYGVAQDDGRVLASGSFYAPYLSGDTTYSLTAFNPKAKEQSWYAVQYLGLKRTPGWHKWTFVFEPKEGVSVLHNDADVNERRERFLWHKTEIRGFSKLVFVGDTTPDANQTLWIDDLKVTLGRPMAVAPADVAPPPPPPATPESDPEPDQTVQLVESLRDVHPRLLFTAEEIPAMREKIQDGYGRQLFERLEAYLPSCRRPDHTRFLQDATDGQRQGFWRLPTVALHAVLTQSEESLRHATEFLEFLIDQEHWETKERDSGMSSANIMVGAALAYDWLYHDLEPQFRARCRDKLLLMARRQYHQGHLMKLPGTHYWQGDPANNHRFHRDAGMTLAILAAAEEDRTDDEWLLAKTLEEIRFIVKWLPEDGSCHESPTYAVFGNTHLTLAADAAQRCFGERFLDHPFFRNAPSFKLHTMTPDLQGVFGFGDSGGGTTGYHSFLHRLCAYHTLRDEQAGVAEMERRNENFFNFAWWSIIWWEPLTGGSLSDLPRQALFPDIGVFTCRTGWQSSDVGAMFKCGPFGGYTLNEFRHRNEMKYVNVAHDDPDANSFILFADGVMLAETDRYSKHKKSSNHNTILINGAGQVAAGRPEGMGWSQPGGDMAHMAVITAYHNGDRYLGIEGEAAGSYLSNPRNGPKRPALDRYRRVFLWLENQYILVLDDIRAPQPVDITWLMQGPELNALNDNDRYQLAKGDAACPFQVRATESLAADIVTSSADSRGKALGHQQLQLKATTAAMRVASLYDPWHKGELTVSLEPTNQNEAVVTVKGPGIDHTWQWQAGEAPFGPSHVTGRNAGGEHLFTLSEEEPHTKALLAEIEAIPSKE